MSSETNHGHHTEPTGYASVPWSVAASATLHCLTGCAIGEVLGMVIGTAARAAQRCDRGPVDRAGVRVRLRPDDARRAAGRRRVRHALRIALAADTVSIAVMEIIDNAVDARVPRSHGRRPDELAVLGVLAFALVVAFVVTVPVNRWMIGRGRGHAVVHAYHH